MKETCESIKTTLNLEAAPAEDTSGHRGEFLRVPPLFPPVFVDCPPIMDHQ